MRTIRLASHMRHETIDLSKRLVLERNVYLGFSLIQRINLSPFTKDFRGGELLNESYD